MKKNLRLTFLKGDILAILLVAILALAVMRAFVPGKNDGQQAIVQVWMDGKIIRELPLEESVRMEAKGEYLNVICVEDGRAAIIESDCPGADCVHSGWIASPGRSVVCLPNRVEVRITGTSEVDFAVG